MTTVEPADLVLGPATRLLWRSPEAVHLELGNQAMVVEGLPLPVIRQLVDRRRTTGTTPLDDGVARVLDDLADAGFLWAATEPEDDRLVPPVPRLAGELHSLAVRHGERAAQVLNARRHCRVTVHGNGRSAAHLAALLAAAGVGRVHCAVDGSVRLSHPTPGGVEPRDEGRALAFAADAAIHRAAPEVDTTPLPCDDHPDLTVLALDSPVDENHRAALHVAGAAHLLVTLGADHGVVGPLVIPGLTSCLHCADLHRRDRDPAWSALAAQLTVGRRYGATSDVCVSTVIVGAAAMQALTFLDGGEPTCVEGTIELALPDWRLRRRSRPGHPDCGCTAGA
ncbi:MAG: thiamine biosynthesis protein ThiF [Jatrophihabitans sp.]